MQRLSHKDLDRISAFLRELYAEVRYEQLPKVILEGLAELIPCECDGFNEIDSKTNRDRLLLLPAMPEVLELMPVAEAHFSEHPQLNYYRTTPDRKAYQFTDFMSARQFRETGLYCNFFRPIDSDHHLTCMLSEAGARCEIVVAFNRRRKNFDIRDRAVLDFVRPHLIQARLNAMAFSEAERKVATLGTAMAEHQVGVITLNPEGVLTWATSEAIQILEHYFPGALSHSKQLPQPLDQWVRKCRSQLAEGAATTVLPLTVSTQSSRLQVTFASDLTGSVRLLLSGDWDFSSKDRGRMLGLTTREAEVMHWIIEGKTNPEIGAILGASTRTVHKHVERIFTKLNVQTRSAAVREVFCCGHKPTRRLSLEGQASSLL